MKFTHKYLSQFDVEIGDSHIYNCRAHLKLEELDVAVVPSFSL